MKSLLAPVLHLLLESSGTQVNKNYEHLSLFWQPLNMKKLFNLERKTKFYPSAAKRLYASTLELQYSACVSPYKCLLYIFMLYGYLSLAALVQLSVYTQAR